MPRTKSAVVVGGGVIGRCAAYYAARRGWEVTLVEATPPGDAGCSHGNAGLIVPSHFIPLAAPGAVGSGLRWLLDPESPFYIRPRADLDLARWLWRFLGSANADHVARSAPVLRDLNLASRAAYEALAAEGLDFGLVRGGLLSVCLTEATLKEEAEVAIRARELGLSAEVLDAGETCQREPSLSKNVAGSVYYPQDCHLSPERFLRGLGRQLERLGVRMMWNRPVTGWQRTDGRVCGAETSEGLVEGDEFVIAGGSWSAQLVRQLGLSLPLQAGRGYNLTLVDPPRLPANAALCVEAHIAVTPMEGRLRFAGTMELAGLEHAINPARIRGMTKSIPRYYPSFGPDTFRDVQPWSGLRPCSPDGLPYIGRIPEVRNVIIATGHAMMGLSLGPVTGQLVTEILEGHDSSVSLEALRPERFG